MLDPILSNNVVLLDFDRSSTYEVRPDGRHLRLTHFLDTPENVRVYLHRMPFGLQSRGIVAVRKCNEQAYRSELRSRYRQQNISQWYDALPF